jgi:hypothetical protein
VPRLLQQLLSNILEGFLKQLNLAVQAGSTGRQYRQYRQAVQAGSAHRSSMQTGPAGSTVKTGQASL